MNNKKVLIITYYWPPNGGSGVQRWLKFVKYLPSFGWEPIVFTPANSSFNVTDASLAKDIPADTTVIKFPIWEPQQLFAKVMKMFGKKEIQQSDILSSGKKSSFQRVSTWIRGNFFIPDARIFWVKPSVKFLEDYLRKNDITRIVTTGPPHSMHLIGLRLKKMFPDMEWIADFRDPWSEWDLLDSLLVGKAARKSHQKLEREVLKNADTVVTISPYYVRRFEALGGRPVELITNGFDEEDFKNIPRVRTTKFTIRHVGNIDELRDPRPAMMAIKAACLEREDLREALTVEFVGSVNASFKDDMSIDEVLKTNTRFISHMPHGELVSLYGSTDVQLLVLAHQTLAEGNIPGKVFEYLASQNPILAIGSKDGDVAKIIRGAQAGDVFDRGDLEGMKNFVLSNFDRWTQGAINHENNVAMYSRKGMTEKLVGILEEKKDK